MFRRKRKGQVQPDRVVPPRGQAAPPDPIAARLREHMSKRLQDAEPGKPDVPTYTPEEWAAIQGEPLHIKNARKAAQHPRANYETMDFVASDDEKVMKFLKELGYEPNLIEKATIICEVGKPLSIEIKGYALDKVTYGSTIRAWEPES